MNINFVTPDVVSLAETQIYGDNISESGMEVLQEDFPTLLEFAGRACYQSFNRPNPATADPANYLRNIIRQGHESVLEHATVTFYITGVSRAFTHELIRHRHLSYSQLSQRFVDEATANFVIPPSMENDPVAIKTLEVAAKHALAAYTEMVESLQNQGLPRKHAREAARAVLPNMTETRIVVTGNHRAWREFLSRRLAPDADAEMRKVAQKIYDQLRHRAPELYEDVT